MRDMLFLSHASPEDNEFTLWLALQLANQGYPVWCDLTKFLGGEDFWKDIEHAIRDRTVKFLYVLSRTSNIKAGPRKELLVAQNVERERSLNDFIIPLHIDDLPPREVNIELGRLNLIRFEQGWANGLKLLLEKLERDNLPKDLRFTPNAVTSWWRTHYSADEGVEDQREEYLSNWYSIKELPPTIYFHTLTKSSNKGKIEIKSEETLPYPAFQHNKFLVSFAKAADFEGKLGDSILIESSKPFPIHDFLDGVAGHGTLRLKEARKEGRDFVCHLLRLGWQLMLRLQELPIYEMANGNRCFWFEQGFAENDAIWFQGVDGKRTHRSMVGYKTVSSSDGEGKKRHWHFGIQAKPTLYPAAMYVIKPHVVFSDDGETVWDDKEKMHRARRSQCKNWWNSDWRDRITAVVSWLTGDSEVIEVPLGSDISIQISTSPSMFSSPVSYTVVKGSNIPIEDEDEEDDEENGVA